MMAAAIPARATPARAVPWPPTRPDHPACWQRPATRGRPVTTSPAPAYRWVGTGLLRASTDPGGLDLPGDLDLSVAESGVRWLASVWARDEVRAAGSDPSPALRQRSETLITNASADTKQ